MAIENNTNALLTFKVGPFRLGVLAAEVDAIISMPAFRSIPLSPPSVAGVFTHRDHIACIISLRRKFGLPELADRKDGQLILAHLKAGLTAFWVDEVLDMESLSEINSRPLSALSASDAFDRFAFKEDQIYLYTNLEALFDLDETDVASAAITIDTERLSAKSTAAQTESAQTPTSAEQNVLAETAFEHHEAPEADAETPGPPPSGTAAKTPSTGVSRPIHHVTRAESGTAGTSSVQQVRSLLPPRQHRPHVSRQAPHRRFQRPAPLPPSPAANRDHYPATSNRTHTVLVLFILLAIVIGGMLAFFLWPDKAPTVVPTARTANPPVDATTPPDARSDAAVTTDIETSLPSRETSGGDSTDIPVLKPDPDPPPEPAVAEPAVSVLKAPHISGRSSPAIEHQAVWRVETDDFILTIERPQPEKPAPALSSSPPPTTGGMHERVHTVVAGDTLWHIAQQYLGDPFRYPELAALSRIEDPDLIYPGDIVRIKMKK